MVARSTRRQLVVGFAGLATLASVGCGRARRDEAAELRGGTPGGPSGNARAASMTVYRDPGCGCCEEWAARARAAGFRVTVANSGDMPAIKRRFGVPDELASCHTTLVGDHVIEGHVPLEDVRRLLATRPAGLKGIAVPGMPRGSPGMEMPDGSADPFQVLAFGRDGRISVFRP